MAKTYRKLQQWDRWLETEGEYLLEMEALYLRKALAQFYGKHALLIGSPQQYDLLKATAICDQIILSPLMNHTHQALRGIESELHELPVATGSVDLVILPHTLDFVDHPRHLLAEACRIVKPEGHIAVFGFNPNSCFGIRRFFSRKKDIPWSGHFHTMKAVKHWLSFADFQMLKQSQLFYQFSLKSSGYFRFLELLGRHLHLPFGDVYFLLAEAKVIPLTPIKMRWKQKIYSLSLPDMGKLKPTIRNR